MNKIIIISLVGSYLTLIGCECRYEYSYKVVNESSDTVVIHWSHDHRKATTEIASGSTETILTTDHAIEACKGPYEGDVDGDFSEFDVLQNDSIESNRQYLNNKEWVFEKKDQLGTYSATVTQAEFE